MKPVFPCHIAASSRAALGRTLVSAAVLLALGAAMPSLSFAQPQRAVGIAASPALDRAVQDLRAEYRAQQLRRLAGNDDRDSLIAAVLLGISAQGSAPPDGQSDAADRLNRAYGGDALALFVLALACQQQGPPCAQPQAYATLRRIAPDNAVHWLLLPQGAAPDDAQLHAAAGAARADSQLRDITRILRAALAGQPAPAGVAGVDAQALALQLSRDAIARVPLPTFAGVVSLCKAASAQRRTDCIALGRHLLNDRSGAILARMVGSAMLRRLVKGTPEADAAKALRRDYVWLSEQLADRQGAQAEQLQDDVVAHGEWEAWQRAAERIGAARTPPADWVPRDPEMLLLPEERAAAPAR